jgi:uncharacterized protein (DUF58 family)
MAEELKKYVDPDVLNKISRLELKARHIVEGFIAGMHRSPYKGFSVEFAEHREYSPGDDLRHLDWKVFGRSDRLMLKEYELETNLRTHILLDTSASMEYRSNENSKLELGCFVAASMAYLILRQQDSVSITTFDKEVRARLPSSNAMGHLRAVLTALGMARPDAGSDLKIVLDATAERLNRRGLVILISDLFDEPDKVLGGLQHLRHRRHDVIVFHILDRDELQFPFHRLMQFEGLEQVDLKLRIDPEALRKAYLEEVGAFCRAIEHGCLGIRADYHRISTDQRLDARLAEYLVKRLGTRGRRPR